MNYNEMNGSNMNEQMDHQMNNQINNFNNEQVNISNINSPVNNYSENNKGFYSDKKIISAGKANFLYYLDYFIFFGFTSFVITFLYELLIGNMENSGLKLIIILSEWFLYSACAIMSHMIAMDELFRKRTIKEQNVKKFKKYLIGDWWILTIFLGYMFISKSLIANIIIAIVGYLYMKKILPEKIALMNEPTDKKMNPILLVGRIVIFGIIGFALLLLILPMILGFINNIF